MMEEWQQLRKVCTNPDLLTEVTFGGHLEYADGSVPMVAKTNTGRMSPVRGRTMKEYDQQIAELKKENFDLKLRIYFLEERMNQKHGKEDEFKINVALKIEVESYKKELAEKQALLKDASETINKLSQNFSHEVETEVLKYRAECDARLQDEQERAEFSEKQMKEAENQLHQLQTEYEALETDLQGATAEGDKLQDQLQDLKEEIEDKDRQLAEVQGKLGQTETELRQVQRSTKELEVQLRDELEKQITSIGRRDRDIQRLSFIVKEKTQIDGLSVLETSHLQDKVEDQSKCLEKLQKRATDKEEDCKRKDQMIGKLEDLLRDREKEKKALAARTQALEKDLGEVKHQLKAMTFQMTNSYIEATHEAQGKQEKIDQLQDELSKAKNELHLAAMERHKEQKALEAEKAELTGHTEALDKRIVDQEEHIEKLVKSLGRKEGELEGFRDLLKKAEESLGVSEAAVQNLQEELRKERQNLKHSDHERYRKLERQLREKDEEIARLQAAVREKDDLLKKAGQDLQAAQDRIRKLEAESREHDLSARDALRGLEKALQDALDDKESALHEKDRINRRLQGSLDAKEMALQEEGEKHRKEVSNYRYELEMLRDDLHKRDLQYQGKLRDLDSVAQRLDFTVGGLANPAMQQILEELLNLRGAVQIDRHINIEVNPGVTHGDTQCDAEHGKTGRVVGSRIPVRKSSSTDVASNSSPDYTMVLQKQVTDLKARIADTESMLKATEETVRLQTQKMKHYKHMLIENGLLPKSLSRCSSDSNLVRLGLGTSFLSREKSGSTEVLPGARGLTSPVSHAHSGRSQDTGTDLDTLQRENAKLREQLECHRRTLKLFQSRSPSPQSEDTARKSLSGNQARGRVSTVGSWLNEINKLLQELSQGDQDTYNLPHTSSSQISRLCRGLEDARGILMSTTSSSADHQDGVVSSSQRSPDGGSWPQRNGHGSPDGAVTQSSAPPLPTTPIPHSSVDSVERMRKSVTKEPRDVSFHPTVFKDISELENSVFSNAVTDGNGTLSAPHTEPHDTVDGHAELYPHNVTAAYDKTFSGQYDKTFTASYLAEHTFADDAFSRLADFEDMSIDLDTESSVPSQSNLPSFEVDRLKRRAQVLENINETLKKEVQWYKGMVGEKGVPGGSTVLEQHLEEIRKLRLKLEQSLNDCGDLEEKLRERPKGPDPQVLSHEATIIDLQQLIQNLRQQLANSHSVIREKVTILEEKEKVIQETEVLLVKQRDLVSRESSEKDSYRERVTGLEAQLKQHLEREEKMNHTAKQLKEALEQYRRRVEQLNGDTKQHKEVSAKYQQKACELEEELQQDRAESQENREELQRNREELRRNRQLMDRQKEEVSSVQQRLQQLESDNRLYKDSEEKCRGLLGQSRLRVTELEQEICTLKERIKCQTENVIQLKSELDQSQCRNEDQLHKIHESATVIEQHKRDLDERNHAIKQMEAAAREQNTQLEGQAAINSQLSLQLEQQRRLSSEQKQRLDKQGKVIKDFEQRLQKMNAEDTGYKTHVDELERKLQHKDRVLKEAVTKKEKYLHNLKVASKELQKYRVELKSVYQDLEEKGSLNRTLKLELSVHEKMADGQGLFNPDEKQSIIFELLKEIQLLRLQMERVIEENGKLRKTMEELLAQKHRDESSSRSQGTDATDGQPTPAAENVPRHSHLESPDTTVASTDSGNEADQTGSGSNRSVLGNVSLHGAGSQNGNVTWSGSGSQELTPCADPLSCSLPVAGTGPTSSHFSIPGPLYAQKVSDRSLHYHVDDSPQYLSGMTQVRIDSDLRTLFALGKVDDFEKLKKEVGEALVILKGMSTRVDERLKVFRNMSPSESVEYSTLKELSMATQNLRICLDEENSLIGCFWFSELPAPNERGEFVNRKQLEEVESLKRDIQRQANNYQYMCQLVEEANRRLNSANLQKVSYTEDICMSLETTTKVLSQAKHNLQHKMGKQQL